MHFSLHLFIYMVIFTCFCEAELSQYDPGSHYVRDEPRSMVTIDAALSYREDPSTEVLLLFSGHSVVGLKNRKESFRMERKELKVPDSLHLQAAFQANPDVRYYYGDKYGYYIQTGANSHVRRLKYGPKRKFIRNGGPDAVGVRAGAVHIFKGCKLAIRNSWHEWQAIVEDIGVMGFPCNVDAAWGEGEHDLVVLKGDQFWRMERNGMVNGPHAFSSNYTLNDWTLKPSDEVR